MPECRFLAIDVAKNVFQLHCAASDGLCAISSAPRGQPSLLRTTGPACSDTSVMRSS